METKIRPCYSNRRVSHDDKIVKKRMSVFFSASQLD